MLYLGCCGEPRALVYRIGDIDPCHLQVSEHSNDRMIVENAVKILRIGVAR